MNREARKTQYQARPTTTTVTGRGLQIPPVDNKKPTTSLHPSLAAGIVESPWKSLGSPPGSLPRRNEADMSQPARRTLQAAPHSSAMLPPRERRKTNLPPSSRNPLWYVPWSAGARNGCGSHLPIRPREETWPRGLCLYRSIAKVSNQVSLLRSPKGHNGQRRLVVMKRWCVAMGVGVVRTYLEGRSHAA